MKFKKIKLGKEKSQKTNNTHNSNIILLLLLVLTITLTVGYGALSQDLSISSEAVFRVEKDIRITNLELQETTNNGIESYSSKYSKDTIKIGIDLKQIDSMVTYKVTVANTGNVSMIIDAIKEELKNNEYIEYELQNISLKEAIEPATKKEFTITFKYKEGLTALPEKTNLDIKLLFKFIKPNSILATPQYVNIFDENSDFESIDFNCFNGNVNRMQIESIKFAPTTEVGNGAINSWDASEKHDNSVIAWYTDTDNNGLYELTIGGNGSVIFPKKSYNMFFYFTQLKSIDFSYVDTSQVDDMSFMFFYVGMGTDSGIQNLDLTKFDTKNVTNMTGMFAASAIQELDLTKFNTEKVTDMSLMFSGCQSKNLNVSSFNTKNVTNMMDMFSGVYVTNLNLKNFDTSKVTDMSSMFSNCENLKTLDLSSFDTSNVITVGGRSRVNGEYQERGMFSGSPSIESIIFSEKENFAKVKDMTAMFYLCTGLKTLDLTSFNTRNAENMSYMFYECDRLQSIDLSSFDTSNVTTVRDMFSGCSSLINLDLRNATFDKINDTLNDFMFDRGNIPSYLVSATIKIIVKDEKTKAFLKSMGFTVIDNYNRYVRKEFTDDNFEIVGA